MSQEKWALLVGIDKYVNLAEKYQLKGCVNDARVMKSVLTDHFGFEDERITELHDEGATRAGMLAAMEALVERIGRDDIVVFHYSGHGSRRTAASLEEGSGKDSTLITHDSGRNPLPNLDISDDEIHEWLEKLSKKTGYITLTFDCCHSGTITRDAFGAQARAVEEDLRSLEDMGVEPRPLAPQAATRDVGASGWLAISDKYVVMSGCRDNELANEFSDQDNGQPLRNGALTRFLTEALLSARPGSTYRDVFEQARLKVNGMFPAQHPQIEGAQDREVLGVRDVEPMRFVPVDARDGRTVTLGGGAAHGLVSGSTWAVYPAGTKSVDGIDALGTVKVDSVGALTTTAQVEGDAEAIVPGCRCTEASPSPRQFELRVDVSPLPDAERARIVESIEASPLVRVADSPEGADVRLYVIEPRQSATADDPLPQIPAIDRRSWALIDKQGDPAMPLRPVDDDDALKIVIDNLEVRSRFRNALLIDNPGTALRVEFNLYAKGANDEWVKAHDGETEFEAARDAVAFEVVNHESRPVFLSVLDFGLTGKISLLYPPNKSSELIEAGARLQIGMGERKVRLSIPDTVQVDRGVETFKAFITTEETDFRWLQQQGTRSGDDGATPAPSDKTMLERLFAAAYNGPRTREASLDAPETVDDWATKSRPFVLRRPLL